MKLTVHTERGTYTSKKINLTNDQAKQLQELLETSASEGTYFKLDTDTGYVVIGTSLLKSAVFVVES